MFLIGMSLAVSANTVTASPYRDTIPGYDEAYLRMYEAIDGAEKSADLSDLKLKDTELVQLYSDIVASCPEFFYLDSRVAYSYIPQGMKKVVTTVNFVYRMEGEMLEQARQEYETELTYIVSLVNPSMNETEKALWVHDYLIASYAYDESQTIFDAHSLFTQRTGVCQAYSLAYAAVMRELGVEAVMVTSPEMNHAWNLVKIGENWYHVDLVYDDPTPDRIGRVNHENFLLDDEGIRQTSPAHHGWISSVKCTDDGYADSIWRDVKTRMVWMDKQWYYIDDGTSALVSSLLDGRYRLEIFEFDQKWSVEGAPGQYWVGVYSGLSDCLGLLFFNTTDTVYTYNPDTGRTEVYLEETDGRIFGSAVCKNVLEYIEAESPDDNAGILNRFVISDFIPEEKTKPLPFDDVTRLDSCYASVRYVYEHGLFQGVSSTKFAPDASLTRAMFVTVLGRLCRIDPEEYGSVSYDDVEEGLWYTPYVEWASQNGIVNGVGNDLFAPMGELTREQMYKIVARCGMDLDAGDMDFRDIALFYDDAEDISDWAVYGVSYCMKNGLIAGDGVLAPQAKATREETAVMIHRFALLCGIG
ncbi:MAG: S-layer homology domain-containing protein [Clostridia bacterium]|nr:S-layer homology domain-containing protein [Clostridia bacterium]